MEINASKTFSVPESRYESLRTTLGESVHVNLVKIRLMCDLYQVDVAKFIGVNRETYSNYERGRCKVPSNIVLLLADMYQIPIDLIFGRTDNPIVKNFYCNDKNYAGGKK